MKMAAPRIVCCCQRRRDAQSDAAFLYWPEAQGRYFPELPLRKMSPVAHFRAFIDRSEYAHEDHSGEPFVFELCPFCGHELPGVPHLRRASDGFSDPDQ